MKAVIVFDSEFGNTERVARAIAGGLRNGKIDVRPVAELGPGGLSELGDPDLVVIGGPTQRHGLSPGLRRLLQTDLCACPSGAMAAAFDTRFHMSRLLTGSAARKIAHRLRHCGCRLLVPPESFFVEPNRDGPLEDGELEHAAAWGRALGHVAFL